MKGWLQQRRYRMGGIMYFLASNWLLGGCVTNESRVRRFLDRDLSGMIAGEEWVYQHAYVDPTIETPKEDDYVFVFLAYKPKSTCPKLTGTAADRRTVMVSAPKRRRPTKLKRGSPRTLMFQYEQGGQPVAAAAYRGRIRLSSIGTKRVVGQIVGRHNDDNWVNGGFSATVCRFRDLR